MNIGPFFPDDPIALTLCADSQFSNAQPDPDIVWQLRFEPNSAINLYTTLGLQARSFQLFPQFSLNKVIHFNLADLFSAPRIEILYSNFTRLVLTPFEELEAQTDLWVKEGGLLIGRLRLTNHSEQNHEVGAGIAARLVSLRGGSELRHVSQAYQNCLKATSGNLSLQLTLEGMSKPVLSPIIGLEQSQRLEPGQSFDIFWQLDILESSEQNISKNQIKFPANWDAEIARLELFNQTRLVQITTPLANWDAALYSQQNQAFQLLQKGLEGDLLIQKSRGIHTIYPALQANTPVHALELWQMIMSLMPAQTQLAAQLFANYLDDQLEQCVDNKLSDPPFPCLAQLAWKIHQLYQDKVYLRSIFPKLLRLCRCWFNQDNDRDQDGLPEWQTLEQCKMLSLDHFNLSEEASLPTRINTTESFGLASLLLIELENLQNIAKALEDESALAEIQSRMEKIQTWLTANDAKSLTSGILDHESHQAHPGQMLYEGDLAEFGQKSIYLNHASRLNLRIKSELMIKKPVPFTIIGESRSGEAIQELVTSEDLLWLPGSFFLTSKQVYARIDRIEDFPLEKAHLQLYTANLRQFDLSWLFKEFHSATHTEPESYLRQWLAGTKFGLPELLSTQLEDQTVNLSWNAYLVSLLVDQDERELAFQLFSQLMSAQIALLKTDHASSERWQATTARGQGYKNAPGGLLPINLFLELAGVAIYHQNKVRLWGANPFPWQVKIRYRGLEVIREGKNSTVIFPNGQIEHHFGSSMKTFAASPNDSQFDDGNGQETISKQD